MGRLTTVIRKRFCISALIFQFSGSKTLRKDLLLCHYSFPACWLVEKEFSGLWRIPAILHLRMRNPSTTESRMSLALENFVYISFIKLVLFYYWITPQSHRSYLSTVYAVITFLYYCTMYILYPLPSYSTTNSYFHYVICSAI